MAMDLLEEEKAIKLIQRAASLVEEDQEDVDYNDILSSIAELAQASREFLKEIGY